MDLVDEMGRHAPKLFAFVVIVVIVVLAFECVVGATLGQRWVLPAAAGLMVLMLAAAFSASPFFLWMAKRSRDVESKPDLPK